MEHRHAWIDEAALADAMLGCPWPRSIRIVLKGESLRAVGRTLSRRWRSKAESGLDIGPVSPCFVTPGSYNPECAASPPVTMTGLCGDDAGISGHDRSEYPSRAGNSGNTCSASSSSTSLAGRRDVFRLKATWLTPASRNRSRVVGGNISRPECGETEFIGPLGKFAMCLHGGRSTVR